MPPARTVNCEIVKGDKRRKLEDRIDSVLEVACSAERAALEIGAAAFDAADQARRAADMALVLASGPRGEAPPVFAGGQGDAEIEIDPQLRHFTERADRVVARLRALDRLPVPATGS